MIDNQRKVCYTPIENRAIASIFVSEEHLQERTISLEYQRRYLVAHIDSLTSQLNYFIVLVDRNDEIVKGLNREIDNYKRLYEREISKVETVTGRFLGSLGTNAVLVILIIILAI